MSDPNDDMWGALEGRRQRAPEPVKESNKKPLIIAGSALGALVLVAGLGFAFLGSDEDPAPPVQAAPTKTDNTPQDPTVDPEEVAYDDPALPQDTWQQEQFTGDVTAMTDEQKAWAAEQVEGTRLNDITRITVQSEEAGFTSDISKAKDKLGLPNPMYSFWTQDLFVEQSTTLTETLLNPNYGGWAQFQKPKSGAKDNFNPQLFKDVFSKKYQKQNFDKKDKSYLPVLADWKNNNYGESPVVRSAGAYWYGEIKNADSEWIYDDKLLNYVVNATYEVQYTGLVQGREKIIKNGTLTVTFVPNFEATGNESAYRVAIDKATLTMQN